MGSKHQLLSSLYGAFNEIRFKTVLDAFSGSGVVSYLLKTMGKEVRSNDSLMFCYHLANATVANSTTQLSSEQIEALCEPNRHARRFIRTTFKGLYFSDPENAFLDNLLANITDLPNERARSVALAAAARACIKRRPRGIFTYVGDRYDDGRRDLRTNLKDHFVHQVGRLNAAVFDSGKPCRATFSDTLRLRGDFDLVYLDPPYVSPFSDNDYTRRYHFVEGLVRGWVGLEIQSSTITKKFLAAPTPFRNRRLAGPAFEKLFRQYADSTIVLSYSSTGIPNRKELVQMLKRVKRRVEVVAVDHQYSFGTHNHKINNVANKVEEYLFIAD